MISLHHIAFEITDRCNLDCAYCYNIWKTGNVPHEHFNSYPKAIATLKKLFSIADVRSIAFTGGEPFLSERFTEIVLFCRMENKQVTVISNGTQGNSQTYKQLLKIGVGLFEFPVHSANESVHDGMVGVKGSWKKSAASVREVLGLGGYVVPVVVITKYNVNELGQTLDFIASLGCKRIMLNRYNIGGKNCANPMNVSASASELHHAFSVANEKAVELDLQLTSNVCSPVCLLNPDDYPMIGFGHCSFDVLSRPITLDINGNIRYCNHSPMVAGNIYEKELHEILYSEYNSQWEKSVPVLCTSCSRWQLCKGGCRAASEQYFQTLGREDPIISCLIPSI